MNITPELYQDMTKQASPGSKTRANVLAAFLSGGCICAVGQVLLEVFAYYGLSEKNAALWTSATLIVLASAATGLGLYGKLAKRAGAGTLVPITGFSNAISSAAIEARSEGYVLGVGAKIFAIAGPAILYGCAASTVYGVLYYIISKA